MPSRTAHRLHSVGAGLYMSYPVHSLAGGLWAVLSLSTLSYHLFPLQPTLFEVTFYRAFYKAPTHSWWPQFGDTQLRIQHPKPAFQWIFVNVGPAEPSLAVAGIRLSCMQYSTIIKDHTSAFLHFCLENSFRIFK